MASCPRVVPRSEATVAPDERRDPRRASKARRGWVQYDDSWGILNNVAATLYHQAEYAAAESCYREVIAVENAVFGPEHTSVPRSMNRPTTVLRHGATIRPPIRSSMA